MASHPPYKSRGLEVSLSSLYGVTARVVAAMTLMPSVASALNWCVANRSKQDLVYVHAITVSPCKDYAPIGGDGDQVLGSFQTKRFSTGGCIVSQFEIRTQRSRGGNDAGDIKVNFDGNDRYSQAMNAEKTVTVVIHDSGADGIYAIHGWEPGPGVNSQLNVMDDFSCTAVRTSNAESNFWNQSLPFDPNNTNVGATDIAIGGGTVWAIGNQVDGQGNFSILRRNAPFYNQGAGDQAWTTMSTRAVRVSVDGQRNAWIVNAAGDILKFNGSAWDKVDGSAKDISAGQKNGKVWVIGVGDQGGGNFNIFRRDGDKWTLVPGAAVRIAADNNGSAWVVNAAGMVFRYSGETWVPVPGVEAVDIAIGVGDDVLVVNRAGQVLRYNGPFGWQQLGAGALFSAIAVDDNGRPWGVSRFRGYVLYNPTQAR